MLIVSETPWSVKSDVHGGSFTRDPNPFSVSEPRPKAREEIIIIIEASLHSQNCQSQTEEHISSFTSFSQTTKSTTTMSRKSRFQQQQQQAQKALSRLEDYDYDWDAADNYDDWGCGGQDANSKTVKMEAKRGGGSANVYSSKHTRMRAARIGK